MAARRAVLQVPGGPALGHVVGALHAAANLAEDGAVAGQLADLAARLRWVPRPLVRRIVFPAKVPDTVDLIAVRSPIPNARPQVFVLSAVPEQLLPQPTALDEERWFQEADAWREMLRKGPGLIQGDP
jgi:hypothetical protein